MKKMRKKMLMRKMLKNKRMKNTLMKKAKLMNLKRKMTKQKKKKMKTAKDHHQHQRGRVLRKQSVVKHRSRTGALQGVTHSTRRKQMEQRTLNQMQCTL